MDGTVYSTLKVTSFPMQSFLKNSLLSHAKGSSVPPRHTNLGAIKDDKVIVFSGGISALVLPIITKLSPEGTPFTLPLNHPVAPAVDAISTAKGLQKQIVAGSKSRIARLCKL
nr:uncharacterized protein LOC112492412 [Ipomoea batatas]